MNRDNIFVACLVGGLVSAGFGADRGLKELKDVREITPQRVEVTETHGFFGEHTSFYWAKGGMASVGYGCNTLLLQTPCGSIGYMAPFTREQAELVPAPQGALEEACEVLDCDGICSEWQGIGGQL